MDGIDLVLLCSMGLGGIGVTLLVVAGVMVVRQGGWKQAMAPRPGGRWNPARQLMLAGALLCFLFSAGIVMVAAIPGAWPLN